MGKNVLLFLEPAVLLSLLSVLIHLTVIRGHESEDIKCSYLTNLHKLI